MRPVRGYRNCNPDPGRFKYPVPGLLPATAHGGLRNETLKCYIDENIGTDSLKTLFLKQGFQELPDII
jgi:hypothetical protein